ncbi:MAG: FimV family protein, partial [Sulfurimicrobium sp.]
ARLELEEVNGQQRLNVRSQQAVSEPFIRLLIQADCGHGRFSHVFTLLLDPEELAAPSPPVLKSAAVPLLAAPGVAPRKPRILAKPVATKLAARPAGKKPPAPEPAAGAGAFRLKLSSAGLDLSALGKLSEEQRQQLREKQRLLDADDQVANMLSMKNRIMQLESEIGEMKVALAKTNRHLAMSERLAAVPENKPVQASPGMFDKLLGGLNSLSLRGLAGVGLILALLLSVWWRWRRRKAEAWLEKELGQEFAPDAAHSLPATLQGEKHSVMPAPAPGNNNQEDDFYHDVTSIFDTSGEVVTLTEAASVLDEADLYLAYGWSNRAIELLQEYLEKYPDDVQLWEKLFETYGVLGMKQEFEQLALRCQATMDDSGLQVLVQKLGRQLDPANPLYVSSTEVASEAPADASAPPTDTPDTPLEFVLDDGAHGAGEAQAEALQEEGSLGLDPLFPDLFAGTKTSPENESGTGKGG